MTFVTCNEGKGLISDPSDVAADQLHGGTGFPAVAMPEVPISSCWLHGGKRRSFRVHVLQRWIWKLWHSSEGSCCRWNLCLDYNPESVFLDPSFAVSASWFSSFMIEAEVVATQAGWFWTSLLKSQPTLPTIQGFYEHLIPFLIKNS